MLRSWCWCCSATTSSSQLLLLLQSLVLLLEERDAEELVLVLQGYYLLLTDRHLSLIHVRTGNEEIGKAYTVHCQKFCLGYNSLV